MASQMLNLRKATLCALAALLALALLAPIERIKAQGEYDDDDEGYGPSSAGGSAANNGQADADGYTGSYGNDDNYSPNYAQGGDSDAAHSNGGNYGAGNGGGGGAGSQANSSPQSDADSDYENGSDDSAAAASEPKVSIEAPTMTVPILSAANSRIKRDTKFVAKQQSVASPSTLHQRFKRSKHYIGPVYTYVKTDKHAHFKWGVKHKVGKKHHG